MNSPDIKALIDQFGPPGYENAKQVLTRLNENFWAAYYAKQKAQIIFEPAEKEFYEYVDASGIFLPKSADVIRTELSALIKASANQWGGFQALESFRTTQNLSPIVSMLRGQIEHRNFFNQEHYYVHLGNCMLKFDANGSRFTTEPFSPVYRSRNQSPIDYDRKATCPEFRDKLLGHLEPDDQVLLKKYAGQCLLGRNLTQRFIILDGIGGASKGAFVLTLSGVIGSRNIYELRTQLLAERFEIGRMIGRTLLIGPDVKGNFLTGQTAYRIKSLVGGDPLEAETKGSNHRFTTYGVFNLIINSNSRLCVRLEGDQSAWERRLLIVRYEKPYNGQRILEVEKYLLTREAPGILNWCIEGLQELLGDYHQNGDIVLSPDQKTRVTDLLGESDSLRLFVANEIVRDDQKMANGEHYSLTVKEISAEYINDCVAKDWSPLSPSTIEKHLPELMLQHFQVSKSHDIPGTAKTYAGSGGSNLANFFSQHTPYPSDASA